MDNQENVLKVFKVKVLDVPVVLFYILSLDYYSSSFM